MRGFFSKEKPVVIKGAKRQPKDPCEVCGLYQNCVSPKMAVGGKGKKKILIVCEAPGATEDDENDQLVGEAGDLLERHLKTLGINLHRDCYKINAINCRPPKNRTPTKKEIKCCRQNVLNAIEEKNPKHIWLFGNSAIQSFYQGVFRDLGVTRWRKISIPSAEHNAWVAINYHPSYILRNPKDESLKSTFRRDLKFTVSTLNKKRPVVPNYLEQVDHLLDFDNLCEKLEYIKSQRSLKMAFDYETTGLKPYIVGSRIWMIGISIDREAFSFPLAYPYWEQEQKEYLNKLWRGILRTPRIKKISHNMKFEDMWSRIIFKLKKVRGWHWCSMNAAHILDERKYYTGLKFQAYIHFGADPHYGDEIKPYLRPKASTGLNTVDEFPLDKALDYAGLDALFCEMLYQKQAKVLGRRKDPRNGAYRLFHAGLKALSDAQIEGIPVDEIYYNEIDQSLGKQISKLEARLLKGPEAKKYAKITGTPLSLKKEFSTKELRVLLFDIMGLSPKKKTATGLPSVDKETLAEIDTPFTRRLTKRRRLFKIKNTYIAQFLREVYNGKINPFFDLHIPRSYRSSSSLPNFQNIPIREEEAKAYVRKGVFPSPGYKLVFADYGSVEVRIIACYTKDRNLIRYIKDDSTDMHRDEAMELFGLNLEQVTKTIRFFGKNQFVFPEFYGSWYVACAGNLWDTCIDLETNDGVTIKDHLKSVGIITANDNKKTLVKRWGGKKIPMLQQQYDFENHVKAVEKKFWKKFPHVKEWQEQSIKAYQKKGYVDMKFGHRRGGFLTKNQIINTPIQGTAFHCLLWSFIKLNTYSRKHWQFTRLIGQIHDEIIWNEHPDEETEVLQITDQYMTKKIRERFDWIIVPLAIEVEMTEVNQAWYHKKEVPIHANAT